MHHTPIASNLACWLLGAICTLWRPCVYCHRGRLSLLVAVTATSRRPPWPIPSRYQPCTCVGSTCAPCCLRVLCSHCYLAKQASRIHCNAKAALVACDTPPQLGVSSCWGACSTPSPHSPEHAGGRHFMLTQYHYLVPRCL